MASATPNGIPIEAVDVYCRFHHVDEYEAPLLDQMMSAAEDEFRSWYMNDLKSKSEAEAQRRKDEAAAKQANRKSGRWR